MYFYETLKMALIKYPENPVFQHFSTGVLLALLDQPSRVHIGSESNSKQMFTFCYKTIWAKFGRLIKSGFERKLVMLYVCRDVRKKKTIPTSPKFEDLKTLSKLWALKCKLYTSVRPNLKYFAKKDVRINRPTRKLVIWQPYQKLRIYEVTFCVFVFYHFGTLEDKKTVFNTP